MTMTAQLFYAWPKFRVRRASLGTVLLGCVFLVALFGLSGCATTTATKLARATVFYPPLPNPPRIQYLTTFSGPNDITQARSSWLDFLLGKENEETEAIKKPYGVAVNAGRIYVADTRGGGYAVFDLQSRRFEFVQGSGGGKLPKPINISVDVDGNKYVTDTGRDQIVVFDKNDRYLRAYGESGEFKPGDVAVDGDRVYLTDLKHQQVQVLDKATGKPLFKFGAAGSKAGEFVFPTNLAIGPDRHLYVTDTGNFRIQKFTLDGQYVRSYGEVGTGFGQFARPKGVALDRHGRLYVVDAAFQNIQVLAADGRLLMFFGSPGDDPESMNLPTQVVIDYDNVEFFQAYADPRFKLDYVILVANQYGASKVNAYGFGRLEGANYDVDLPVLEGVRPAQPGNGDSNKSPSFGPE
jgi:DNA-binding beta-propeller fold protein YncE